MNEITKCERCQKSFINEEFSGHLCSPRSKRLQEIGIDRIFEPVINENNDKVYMVNGLNGVLYRLVQCIHNPPHPNTYPTTFDNENIRRKFDKAL